MLILGIETSCDETAASVVRDGRVILSNIVSSSLRLHRRYGGVVPEIASRAQVESIFYVVDEALKQTGYNLSSIGAVSVTSGPGLVGALLTGISFAKAICLANELPLIGVSHLVAHLYVVCMSNSLLKFPFIGLVVSGGHTILLCFKDVDDQEILGQTRDDAAGEAFDKVAKILDLSYPGGPVIERLAKRGNPTSINFPRAELDGSLDFSFSGIKTAVMYYIIKNQKSKIKNQILSDICASFQEAVIDVLVNKALLACHRKKIKQLAVGGGVVCNLRLRERLVEGANKEGIEVFFPPKELCLDNAAMIAGLGYQLLKRGYEAKRELTAEPNLIV